MQTSLRDVAPSRQTTIRSLFTVERNRPILLTRSRSSSLFDNAKKTNLLSKVTLYLYTRVRGNLCPTYIQGNLE